MSFTWFEKLTSRCTQRFPYYKEWTLKSQNSKAFYLNYYDTHGIKRLFFSREKISHIVCPIIWGGPRKILVAQDEGTSAALNVNFQLFLSSFSRAWLFSSSVWPWLSAMVRPTNDLCFKAWSSQRFFCLE